MHELAITQSIVEDIADRLGAAQVTKVTLEIGKLSDVVVESIEFCFDLVAEGTTLDGATLVVYQPVGRVRCPICDIQFDTSDPIVLCPACGSASAGRTGDADQVCGSGQAEVIKCE